MLSVSHLSCGQASRPLFSGQCWQVSPGQWLHVRGANGSGKTTLLRTLAGLCPPLDGDVCWQEHSIQRHPDYRAGLRYLGHTPALKDQLGAEDNLAFALALHGVRVSSSDMRAALRHLGLTDGRQRPVRQLSAGQRRRVVLARLILDPGQLWLLDEPFTALDAGACHQLTALMAEHLARGGLIVVTSHQPVELDGGQELML